MRVDYRFPKYPRISPECRDLIQRILVREPDQRLTIQQIQEHPWCARLLYSVPIATSLQAQRHKPFPHCLGRERQQLTLTLSRYVNEVKASC